MSEPCSWCVAELTSAAALFRVVPPSPSPEVYAEIQRAEYGRLAEKVALMRRAMDEGWPIQINNWQSGAVVPVTTWHGDPICEPHLFEAWQRASEPTTVRMAQWGRR